ncbi:hypothetical protein [Pseudomonas putida]|uniref:Phage tail protein n=1 Tax=Pseudomonas putida TaxID=303 RepID=A0A1L7NPP5_PSEPU|nr:hypothetical protein [Pseudomonas putida]BAW27446.1 Uncharacterized protein KF715C_pC130 [Pseudomonas putida]
MTQTFSRTVGKRSGVQLNDIVDQSEQPSTSTVAHNIAIVGRFPRGRIDKVFAVSQGRFRRTLGQAVSLAVSALSEPAVHIYEALKAGTVQAIVSRLIAAGSTNKLMVATAQTTAGSEVWSLVDEATGPTGTYLLAIKHLECFSDGVIAEIHADSAKGTGGVAAESKIVTLQLRDVIDNKIILGPFKGSLDVNALDEFQNSYYIGDVVAQNTDLLQVVSVKDGATVPATCVFYGRKDGKDLFSSKSLKYFTEGNKVYANSDLDAAMDRIKRSRPTFTYMCSGGTENVALLSRLLAMGKTLNRQVLWDIPGRLSPEAAATFYASIGGDTSNLYSQAYWAPLSAVNPVVGGKAIFGTSGMQAGLRCARNARTNAKGIAPRNRPIAGDDYAVNRTSITQVFDLDEEIDLEVLAESRINPVIYRDYTTGGKYAWVDSLTGAQTEGASKLIAVAEMATYVDDTIAAAAQGFLQKPMAEAISEMTKFIGTFFAALQSAGWLQPSAELDGMCYRAEIKANANRPFDKMDITHWLCYDGTNRVTEAQQYIVRV